ncbi:MAG: HEAT repeat domain-containing protein [Gemmataceae bacterium]
MRVTTGALLLGLLIVGALPAQSLKAPAPSRIGGKSLEEWKKDLSSEDASRRAYAIIAITQFGEAASSCVPAIIDRLKDGDVSPRARALGALRTMSIDEKDIDRVVRAVAARLVPAQESQAVIRYEATITLNRFVTDGQGAISNLIVATMDKSSWEIRHNAVSLLWRIGVGMGQEDSPPDQRIVEALLTSLRNDRTYQVRLETIQGLGALGRPANPMLLAKLVSELKLCAVHPNKPLAIWAYCGLVAMEDGKPAEQSLNTLAKFVKSQDLETRIQAATALGALRDKAKSKVPLLVDMLKDKEPYAVQAGASALGALGEAGENVISALLDLTDDKDPITAASAVAALVNLKQNNTRVVGMLEKMREKKDLDLRLRYTIEEGLKELRAPKKK